MSSPNLLVFRGKSNTFRINLQHTNGYQARFFGHLTEHGRVIGFLIERIFCTTRWHTGIRIDLKAVSIDFDTAEKRGDRKMLQEEFESLTVCFDDPSNRGGGGLL
ncbi:hypothetical protein N7486_006642 [Penicillium sp. IBT 16267x]|nr:hypothetical protein N7486_006642 [Penicillium sp. IBT 16267x]